MIKRVAFGIVMAAVALMAARSGYIILRQPDAAPAPNVKVQVTPVRIERGKYLFENVADCDGCHSQRDFSRFGAPVVAGGRGKGFVFPPELGLPGRVVGSNITPDLETGLGRWTDGEKIRAIREGVSRDGRALFPLMPYESYRRMSDEDVHCLVAYLNTMAPVSNKLPATELSFPVNVFVKGVPQPVRKPVPAPDSSDPVKYGEYLASLAGCGLCHTPKQRGEPVRGKEFAGGEEFAIAGFFVRSPNITPDVDSGIGTWTERRFLSKFIGYRWFTSVEELPKSNQANFTLMPWLGLSKMKDEDLKAIYAYLRTLRPVYNPVEVHPPVAPPAR